MKVITDYFTPPAKGNNRTPCATVKSPEAFKKGSLQSIVSSKRVADAATPSNYSDSDDEAFYGIRKIRIRLADPDVPDSYVCEVYDTSPSMEEEFAVAIDNSPLQTENKVLSKKVKIGIQTNVKAKGSTQVDDIENDVKSDTKPVTRQRTCGGAGLKTINGSPNALIQSTEKTDSTTLKKRRRSQSHLKKLVNHESDSSSDEALIVVKKRAKVTSSLRLKNVTPFKVETQLTNDHKSPKKEQSKRSDIVRTSPRSQKATVANTPKKSGVKCNEVNPKISPMKGERLKKSSVLSRYENDKTLVSPSKMSTRSQAKPSENPKMNRETAVPSTPNTLERPRRSRSNIKHTGSCSCCDNISLHSHKLSKDSPSESMKSNDLSSNDETPKIKRMKANDGIKQYFKPEETRSVNNLEKNTAAASKKVNRKNKKQHGEGKKIGVLKQSQSPTKESTINGSIPAIIKTRSAIMMTNGSEPEPECITITPTKECRVVLEKTPIKMSKGGSQLSLKARTSKSPFTDSPTKSCSVILEKLNPNTHILHSSEKGNQSIPLAPLFLKQSQRKDRPSMISGSKKKEKKVSEDVKAEARDNYNSKIKCKKEMHLKLMDPDVLKARQEFLKSGVPLCLRKKIGSMNRQHQEISQGAYFSIVSHVQQRGLENEWRVRNVDLSLKHETTEYASESFKWKSMAFPPRPTAPNQKWNIADIDNNFIEKLETAYKSVKITPLFSVIKEKHSEYLDSSQDSEELLPIWSEKYRLDSEQLLSNDRSIAKMRKWLQSWKLYNEELRDGVRRRKRDEEGSSDDFLSSDEEGRAPRAPVTACLLHGPASSGKTSLVQALAAQLDLQILEVNASSKRSGKKMLADLQGATQSHKILQEETGNIGRAGDKMSIIVVEEADVMFEDHDEGFVSGLQSLIASAKRPVLLLTNDPLAPHLDKFRTNATLQLSMSRPNIAVSCAMLELVCVLEGLTPSRSALLRLLEKNQQDIRRSLLELQFWIQKSGSEGNLPSQIFDSSLSSSRLWWASNNVFFGKDIWHTPPITATSSGPAPAFNDFVENSNDVSETYPNYSNETNLMRNFNKYSECISSCDIISKTTDCNYYCLFRKSRSHLKDSSSLEERILNENYQREQLRGEIENEMTELTARLHLQNASRYRIPLSIPSKEVRWLNTQNKASEELMGVVQSESAPSRTALYCDYLPALREMCRSERHRVAANTKRKNRFYHYLRTLGATPTQSNLDTNCHALSDYSKIGT